MAIIWLCITLLHITAVVSDLNVDRSHIRVFPTGKHSILGVFQVSSLNDLRQPVYAFNASEARTLCLSLGVVIASKAQVKDALARGLETCRFGWVDEHFAVIPRRKALANCGQSQTGLVTWRASVTQKFDVFCFDEADAAAQLKDTTTDSPVTTGEISGRITSTLSTLVPPSSSTPETLDSEAEPVPIVGSAQGSAGAKAVLISSICSVLLVAIIIIVYIKIRRTRILDLKEQQDYLQTEEWTCVKTVKEAEAAEAAEEDERIDVDNNAS